MPSYELTGPGRVYPEIRDVNGRPLGTVQPGDIRMFDEAPDSWWVPVIPPGTGEAASGEGEARGGIESDPDPADIPATPAPAPEPAAGPVPAPPAAVPPAGTAFAVTTDQQ